MAAIFTLIIILYRIYLLPGTKDKNKTNLRKMAVVIIYTAAGYFWTASMFVHPKSWYAIALSILGGLLAYLFGYVTHFYGHETVENKENNNE